MGFDEGGRFLIPILQSVNLFSEPSFLGALLGAILTGLTAILVMIITLWTENARRQRESNASYLKEMKHLLHAVENLSESTKQYAKAQANDEAITHRIDSEGFKTEEAIDIRFNKEIFEKDIIIALSSVNSIDKQNLPSEVTELFLEIKSIATGQIEYFWERSMKADIGGAAEILKVATTKLYEASEKLKSIISRYEENI